jgi:hypothetical protein
MIKTSTNFLNRDSRGIMISQRPAEVKAVRSSRINPFISTISYKLPLGLPSIKNTVIHRKINKGEQHVSHPVKKHIRICNETKIKINDNITQSIQTPDDQTNHNCKLSREEIINLELPHQEVMKNNSVIKEIEPQPKNFCEDIDIDTQNLLNFMNNLDYEKYLKNLEIREALLLIKNKVEREAKEIQREEEVKIESKQGTEPEISFEKLVLPNISVPEIKKAEHDKEWDHSVSYGIKNRQKYLRSFQQLMKSRNWSLQTIY